MTLLTERDHTMNPRITLRRVTIDLPRHAPAEIRVEGEVAVMDRRVGRVSEARILTLHMTESARRFLADLEAAFTTPPAPAKD